MSKRSLVASLVCFPDLISWLSERLDGYFWLQTCKPDSSAPSRCLPVRLRVVVSCGSATVVTVVAVSTLEGDWMEGENGSTYFFPRLLIIVRAAHCPVFNSNQSKKACPVKSNPAQSNPGLRHVHHVLRLLFRVTDHGTDHRHRLGSSVLLLPETGSHQRLTVWGGPPRGRFLNNNYDERIYGETQIALGTRKHSL